MVSAVKKTRESLAGMTKLDDMSEAALKQFPCVLSCFGKTYDVTKWVDHHPGGALIRQYNGLDASDVFTIFHGDEGHLVLNRMTPISDSPIASTLDTKTQVYNQKLLTNFEQLRLKLIEDGYFKSNVVWHFVKVISTLMFMPLALYLMSMQYYFISAIAAGFFWQQLGWLGHDWCHHNTTNNRAFNNWAGVVWGNALQGFSSSWWKDRHNSHHAVTNIVDHDPDIDNIPMLAWAVSDIDRCPKWARSTLQYQAYYFLFLLPVLRLAWMANSVFFVIDMKSSSYKHYQKWFKAEALGLVFHYVATAIIVMQMPFKTALMWLAVSEGLAGFGIAIVVFFNHYSCEKYDESIAENFVNLQLLTTRNLTPGLITDWVCGGLNYQIEHHLFPTMPRHQLSKAAPMVIQFCKDNNVPYMSCGFPEGLGYVLTFLNDMGQIAKEKAEKDNKKMK